MKTIFIVPFLLFPSLALAFSARVERVVDGDTIIVNTAQESKLRVRLYGIDAPETGQTGGADATAFLKKLLPPGIQVDIEDTGADRYGRTVGVVRHGRLSINRSMVAAGYAWVYGYFCKKQFCADWKALQKKARNERLGIWREKSPVPPWRWRKSRKSH